MDGIASLVSNKRRRLLLRYLVNNNGRGSLEEVISYICDNEGDPECRNRKSVYISLKQTHIPKLEKARLVIYDKRSNTLYLEESYKKDVRMYVEFVEGVDISWSKYYLGLAGVATAGSVYLMDFWALAVSFLFLVSASLNIAKQRRVI